MLMCAPAPAAAPPPHAPRVARMALNITTLATRWGHLIAGVTLIALGVRAGHVGHQHTRPSPRPRPRG